MINKFVDDNSDLILLKDSHINICAIPGHVYKYIYVIENDSIKQQEKCDDIRLEGLVIFDNTKHINYPSMLCCKPILDYSNIIYNTKNIPQVCVIKII